MASPLDPQNALKRHVTLMLLGLMLVSAVIATIVHQLQPQPHLINLIAPPLLAVVGLGLIIRLYQSPQSLQQVMHLSLLNAVLLVVLPSWVFTLEAFLDPSKKLVTQLPPFTSGLYLILMMMLIVLRPRQFLGVALLTWAAIAAPILTYLILHPSELMSSRGLDLGLALGPGLGMQIVLILFFNRLQDLVDRLYQERLQYYEKIIERQTIRQQAMEHAVTQIHNGPLQTLALMMREVQWDNPSAATLLKRLDALNAEIRAVGNSLTEPTDRDRAGSSDNSEPKKTSPTNFPATPAAILESYQFDQMLRLGEGTYIDLNAPLHTLLYEVYMLTLKRDLPHFRMIRVKVRNFSPIEPAILTLELKRDLCLWLEETICNVGKHAEGATRLVVTGERQEQRYILQVKDNGCGLQTERGHQGTQLGHLLAERLAGTFQRVSLADGGVLCELVWSVRSS
jgi:hypothetical protein